MSKTSKDELIKEIWDHMLDADASSRYYRALCPKYMQYDRWVKIFLALTTSTTVAGWGLWKDNPAIWQVLSVLSAITGIVNPFLKFDKNSIFFSECHAEWLKIQLEWETIWNDRDVLDPKELRDRIRTVRGEEVKLQHKEVSVPVNRKLLEQMQRAVIESRNLVGSE